MPIEPPGDFSHVGLSSNLRVTTSEIFDLQVALYHGVPPISGSKIEGEARLGGSTNQDSVPKVRFLHMTFCDLTEEFRLRQENEVWFPIAR